MNWITKGDTIIFAPEFDAELDIELISDYTKLIFSDYKLCDDLFERYENNKHTSTYIKSKFNQKIDDLPQNITYLIFGWNFNQDVNNLPLDLTHLTFGVYFNKVANDLPSGLTHLTFGLPRK